MYRKYLHSVDSRGFWVPYVEAWHNVVEAMPLSCHLAERFKTRVVQMVNPKIGVWDGIGNYIHIYIILITQVFRFIS